MTFKKIYYCDFCCRQLKEDPKLTTHKLSVLLTTILLSMICSDNRFIRLNDTYPDICKNCMEQIYLLHLKLKKH